MPCIRRIRRRTPQSYSDTKKRSIAPSRLRSSYRRAEASGSAYRPHQGSVSTAVHVRRLASYSSPSEYWCAPLRPMCDGRLKKAAPNPEAAKTHSLRVRLTKARGICSARAGRKHPASQLQRQDLLL